MTRDAGLTSQDWSLSIVDSPCRRANGPVDNAVSSCLSCHGTAQIPARVTIIPGADATDAQRLEWFRDLPVGQVGPRPSKHASMAFP